MGAEPYNTLTNCYSPTYNRGIVNNYSFVNPRPKKHPQRTTWNHWQLRDVIACPHTKSQFYTINRGCVCMYDTIKRQSTQYMESLNFDPVSIAVSDDYLVVGGQHSELAVTSLKDPRNTKITYIGGSINNYVVFDAQKKGCRQRDSGYMEDSVSHEDGMHMSSQHPHLLLCNNDHTIRIVSVPEINVLFEVQLPTAVNYASVSPDQTKVVAVGDSNEVFLFNKRGSDLELVTTLTGSSDAAFSCDWNQVSDIFAVGSQDGIVNVWDTRSTHKLAILETYQRGRTKGACRNVKFSPSGSVDLLAYSEHTSFVNIVDTRDFGNRQVLRMEPENQEVQVTGLQFSPDSSSLFVGMDHGVNEYTVDTIARRSFPSSTCV